jgi:hypothetical protein
MMIATVNTTFQSSPEGFNIVGVDFPVNITLKVTVSKGIIPKFFYEIML